MYQRVSMSLILFLSFIGHGAQLTDAQNKDPKSPLKIAGICSLGFEDAIHRDTSISFDKPEQEASCDRRNVCSFKILANIPCKDALPGERYETKKIKSYDVDKNGVVDCADYLLWKQWLADEHKRGNRKTSGNDLFIAECEKM